MRKRTSNLNMVFRGGVTTLALLSIVLPGCKKEQPPPVPVQVSPLPKKAVQGSISSAKSAKVSPAGTVAPPSAATTPQARPAAAPGASVPAPVKTAAAVAGPVAVKPDMQKQMSSARVAPHPAAVSLDFTKRRDPFRPYVQAPTPQQSAAGKVAKPAKDLLPIQSFDTESFKVSGIIAGIRENSALVIDPKGKGYVVKEGMLIGSSDGRIKRITTSTVEVEENYRDDGGKVRKRVVKLALTRKK